MASVPSPSPPQPQPQRTPPSASDSGNSAAHSPPSSKNQVEGAANNGVHHGHEKNSGSADGLDDLNSIQYIERFRRYDAEYTRRLMAKYFSGKTLNGGNIFDEQMTINDEVIKSSRLPCFQSYLNPVVGVEEQCSNGSNSPAETQSTIPNGKHMVKKSN